MVCSPTIPRNISYSLLSVLESQKSVFSGSVYFVRAVFVCVSVCVCLSSRAEVWLNASRVWRQINAIIFPSPSSAERNQLCHALVVCVGEAWATGRGSALIWRDCGLLKSAFLKPVLYNPSPPLTYLLNLLHSTATFFTWDGFKIKTFAATRNYYPIRKTFIGLEENKWQYRIRVSVQTQRLEAPERGGLSTPTRRHRCWALWHHIPVNICSD